MKRKPLLEPHLAVQEIRLPKGGEWTPRFRGWCLSHIASGICYWEEPNGLCEAREGSTLVFPAEAREALRASQLNDVAITYFCVETGKLLGLLSVAEQHLLKQIAARRNQAVRVFGLESQLSEQFKVLRPAAGSSPTASARLRLLQLFMEALQNDMEHEALAPAPTAESAPDGRRRLRQMLHQMPASEFVELSVADLAPKLSCSPRHLNRLFREELGTSFREKQIEFRMARACELLATSNAKVINVALESGYQSSSVFSELFKRHHGVSPGQWRRQRHKSQPAPQLLP